MKPMVCSAIFVSCFFSDTFLMVQKSPVGQPPVWMVLKKTVNNGISYESPDFFSEAVELVNCDRCQMQALGKARGDPWGIVF